MPLGYPEEQQHRNYDTVVPIGGVKRLIPESHTVSEGAYTHAVFGPHGGMYTASDDPGVGPLEYFSSYLLDGGSNDLAVNGSITPVDFSYTVPDGKILQLWRTFVTLEHGAQTFVAGNFAGRAVLANGFEVGIVPVGGSFTAFVNWKTNREIRAEMFDLNNTFKANGAYTGRWSHNKDVGNFVAVAPGVKAVARVNDDLSAMDIFTYHLKGRLVDAE